MNYANHTVHNFLFYVFQKVPDFASLIVFWLDVKATTMGKILFVGLEAVALNIFLPGHFSSWNLIEMSTTYQINEGLLDGVGVSLGTRTGGLEPKITDI